MDESWAIKILDAEEAGQAVADAADPELTVSPLGYTPELGYLSLIADRVALVRNAVFAANSEGGAEPHFQPLPRPVTAIERERERRTRIELLDIDRLLRGV